MKKILSSLLLSATALGGVVAVGSQVLDTKEEKAAGSQKRETSTTSTITTTSTTLTSEKSTVYSPASTQAELSTEESTPVASSKQAVVVENIQSSRTGMNAKNIDEAVTAPASLDSEVVSEAIWTKPTEDKKSNVETVNYQPESTEPEAPVSSTVLTPIPNVVAPVVSNVEASLLSNEENSKEAEKVEATTNKPTSENVEEISTKSAEQPTLVEATPATEESQLKEEVKPTVAEETVVPEVPAQPQEQPAPEVETPNLPEVSTVPTVTEEVVTPTVAPSTPSYDNNARNTYPMGQCTWGVKVLAPWVGDYWGNANQWGASAQAAGHSVGTTPVVGAIAVWPNDGGGYGHVAYVTDVQSSTAIQVLESNYSGNMTIGNYRGVFNPTDTVWGGGTVYYIYP